MFNLTPEMLLNAFKKYPYLLVRYPSGKCFAVNSKAGLLAYKKSNPHKNKKLQYCSYRSISFHEYISFKTPFV